MHWDVVYMGHWLDALGCSYKRKSKFVSFQLL